MVICLERCADLHVARPMPLPLTVSCFSQIQIDFTFLVPAHQGSPGQRAVKRVCVCVCVLPRRRRFLSGSSAGQLSRYEDGRRSRRRRRRREHRVVGPGLVAQSGGGGGVRSAPGLPPHAALSDLARRAPPRRVRQLGGASARQVIQVDGALVDHPLHLGHLVRVVILAHLHQTWNWVSGSPGHWVIWVVSHTCTSRPPLFLCILVFSFLCFSTVFL